MKLELKQCSARHPADNGQGRAAITSLSLCIESGEQVAIIGPSGAGKTTLLQVLACALRPSGGEVLFNGVSPWTLRKGALTRLRQSLFLAPQVPPLPPRQRVVTSVLAGALPKMGLFRSLRSLFYPVDIPAADEALTRFDLSEKLFERVDRLSGGERQRVGLARAVLAKSELLLVDEPLSALDPTRAEQALTVLLDSCKTSDATLVSTLHHVEMALRFFPRVIGLRDGEVYFDLPAADITEAMLQGLYEQHLDELTGPAPEPAQILEKPAPVVMTCR
ncbi:phosphonate ABC transporter ATP-binding protein [Limnobacter litoralis]|uniref:Phosphonates import ATP-binding protein PhnC 1 n=1 Tax=Limnobacter litoralis TaxID=481366 RepID=A0ABQ5YSY6_9BURK|nr:ATP-binding cassette domain-containing protein [Limnobacter litoralis]GLR27001.1 phosphonates import ATP-binding protein PhnC 1 [Limnobacter litoralis]